MKKQVVVNSPHVQSTEETITSRYMYTHNKVAVSDAGVVSVTPEQTEVVFRTQRKVPKLGLMLVGLGGNNGTTVTAGIIANREGITWQTKRGVQRPNYFGSITQSSTVRMGVSESGEEVFTPLSSLAPLVHPNDIVIGGWDISGLNLADAMERAQVLEWDLQRQLRPFMQDMVPLPGVYDADFVARNQVDRATNLNAGTKNEQMERIRTDIREFKQRTGVDKVIVLWTATTERFANIEAGLNDTAENLLASIKGNKSEVAPSTLYAVASILEGVSYINGSPQNTFVPGILQLADERGVFIAGDDFKSGQTKFKSVLVEFLVGAGIKPESIASYNHLGNNDGRNLSAPAQFRSKEITKSNVVDDMVASNEILFSEGEHPDHCVVIKYMPFVGDSKRALDEYTCSIFMGGLQTFVVHNTCEDSLLAAPLIIDLAILTELMERVEFKMLPKQTNFERMHSILTILSYLCKAPVVPRGTPLVNALFRQKQCIENVLRALIGIPPDNNMLLEFKTKSLL